MFYFEGADIPAKYDLVNWQKTPEGLLKLVLIGHVDEYDIHLNESIVQWMTGSNQVFKNEKCPNKMTSQSISSDLPDII